MKTHKTTRKGFTLIELLTAVAITTVIIAVLIGTTRMSMDAWKDSRDKARASRLAKESIELMARDLEGVVIRSGNEFEWLSVKMDTSLQGLDLGPANAEMKNPLEFIFFSAATDRYDGEIGKEADKGGDISTVIYKLAYVDQLDPVGKTFPVFSLYRKLINPGKNPDSPSESNTFDNYLAKTDIQTPASGEDVTNSNNFIAENVYNLTVTLVFEYTDSSTKKLVQKRVPIMTSGSDYSEVRIKGNEVLTPGGTALPDDARLTGAELGILVLSDSAMRTLNKKPFTDQAAFAKFVKENSHYFSKSVILPRP